MRWVTPLVGFGVNAAPSTPINALSSDRQGSALVIDYEFYLTVVDALSRNKLTLPTLPDVAVRVGRQCQEPSTSLTRLAEEIATDPATAARLMQVANSAAYGGGRPVTNLPRAVARLGLRLTRTLVNRMVLEQIFVARVPALSARLQAIWARSVEVAATASVLARNYTSLDPATAMLGGLILEIGALPIIRLAEFRGNLVQNPAALDEVLASLQARVGTYLLRAWNFPSELIDIPFAATNQAREHGGPADYADVVCVAALQQGLPDQGFLARITRAHIPALDKLGLPQRFDLRRQAECEAQLEGERLLLAG